MKYKIIIDILFLLLSREKVSAKYIADRFDISLRTVYRYIDELSLSVPLYNIRGRNGGIAICDTYKLPASFLTKEESEFLIGTLNGIKDELNSQTLSSIIDKIMSITKKSGDKFFEFGNLVIDGGPWGNTEMNKSKITLLEKCIEEKKVVYLEYLSRNGEKSQREIEPHTLVLKQGIWYVYAFCRLREKFRLFKLGRITLANETNQTFTRRQLENVGEILESWYNTLQGQDIDLMISKKIKPEIEEWLGVDKVYTLSSGEIRASFNMPIDLDLVGKILSFGNEVKVLEPLSLKKLILKTVDNITKLYN
ncbi:MAG: YafY family transcriptional regulator [Clostridia bacterium]|nr:YafY family transcriptional regulator [Clostridia bacterium]